MLSYRLCTLCVCCPKWSMNIKSKENAQNQSGRMNWMLAISLPLPPWAQVSVSMSELIKVNEQSNRQMVMRPTIKLTSIICIWYAFNVRVLVCWLLALNHIYQITQFNLRVIRLSTADHTHGVCEKNFIYCWCFLFRSFLTMSTVISPHFVAPCDLRNALTFSCSAGIFSASTSFKDLSPEALRTNVVRAGRVFWKCWNQE